MATDVKLPQLGQTMEEGTIVGCMVNVGDEVKKGDIIFEVETDKISNFFDSCFGFYDRWLFDSPLLMDTRTITDF